MTSKKDNYLVCKKVKFYSPEDEDLFFSWINKVTCIKEYHGIGRELQLSVSKPLSFNDFKNLRGLFKRYKLKNPQQLRDIFMNSRNKDWFDK